MAIYDQRGVLHPERIEDVLLEKLL